MYPFETKLSIVLSNVNSVTSGNGSDDGLFGNSVEWFGDSFKKGLVQFGIWFVNGFFYLTKPFMEWGCKSIIVASVIIYVCSQDPKCIRTGLKFFFIYLAYTMIRSAVIK